MNFMLKMLSFIFTLLLMIFCMINEAARCIEERVAYSSGDIDLAMVLGAGWAPFRGGPLRYAESLGIPAAIATPQSQGQGRILKAPQCWISFTLRLCVAPTLTRGYSTSMPDQHSQCQGWWQCLLLTTSPR